MDPHPDAEDYLRLFARYGRDFGDVYLDAEQEQYRLLFGQVCALLLRASPYNLAMPQEFRHTARQWTDGDAVTLAHMGQPQNRHFMLSDLYDYVHLTHHLGGRWG